MFGVIWAGSIFADRGGLSPNAPPAAGVSIAADSEEPHGRTLPLASVDFFDTPALDNALAEFRTGAAASPTLTFRWGAQGYYAPLRLAIAGRWQEAFCRRANARPSRP